MRKNEIVELINQYCVNKEEPPFGGSEIIGNILVHSYLFVRPGDDTKNFMIAVTKSLTKGVEEGINNYFDEFPFGNLSEHIIVSSSSSAFDVVREVFDKDYFEKQCLKFEDDEEEYDESLLEKYMCMMSDEQIHEFMTNIVWVSSGLPLFGNLLDFLRTKEKIYNRCRENDKSIPCVHCDPVSHLRFTENNPLYMFNCMSKEEIIQIYLKTITKDVILAGNLAKVFYYTHDASLIDSYSRIAELCKRFCIVDVYNPKITSF